MQSLCLLAIRQQTPFAKTVNFHLLSYTFKKK